MRTEHPAGATPGDGPAPPSAPGSVDAVLARLRALAAALPRHDGVAVFARLYLTVTEDIAALLAAGGRFADPDTLRALDTDFAGRFLAAVDADSTPAAGDGPPRCWRPLFRLRGHPGIHPLQFALAGMHAHIAHDLPLSVVAVCAARGLEPAEMAADYDRVDAVLAAADEQVRSELLPGPDLLELAEPLTHLVDSWSVARARDAAWATARALWALRAHPATAQDFTAALDRTVGLVCRQLLTPLG